MDQIKELFQEIIHSLGFPRKDQSDIETLAIQAYKDKDYKKVVELCSKLSWEKSPFSSELAFALCFAIWQQPGNDSEIFYVAKKM